MARDIWNRNAFARQASTTGRAEPAAAEPRFARDLADWELYGVVETAVYRGVLKAVGMIWLLTAVVALALALLR